MVNKQEAMPDQPQNAKLLTKFGEMSDTVFQYIQDCRNLENQSSSSDYKIAAKLHGVGPDGTIISISSPNIKLRVLKRALDENGTIGGASDTIHAETAVIRSAPVTEGTDLFVSDPLCPNCMKNAIEAGVARIFIDQRGFDKKWYQNRQDYFDHISLKFAECAGVDVYNVDLENRDIKSLTSHKGKRKTAQDDSSHIIYIDRRADIVSFIEESKKIYGDRAFALSTGRDSDGRQVLIRTAEAFTNGLSESDQDVIDKMKAYNHDQKYRIKNDPVTRLLMASSKYGISLRGSDMYCSHLPSARCQINTVGYGMDTIRIGQIQENTSTDDLDAAYALHRHGILHFTFDDTDIELGQFIDTDTPAPEAK